MTDLNTIIGTLQGLADGIELQSDYSRPKVAASLRRIAAEIEGQQERIEKLTAALEQYAEPENWTPAEAKARKWCDLWLDGHGYTLAKEALDEVRLMQQHEPPSDTTRGEQ